MSRFSEKPNSNILETRYDESKDLHGKHSDRASPVGQGSKLLNPLSGLSKAQIFSDVEAFCRTKGLEAHIDTMKKGALLAQRPHDFDDIEEFSEEERAPLRHAAANKWAHPFTLYYAGQSTFI
jgi:hypothetical protein